LQVTTPADRADHPPCVTHAGCVICTQEGNCDDALDFAGDALGVNYGEVLHGYGSSYEYTCEHPAKGYDDGVGGYNDSHIIECDWDGNWQPSNIIPTCICKYLLG